jgi:hypothetical protein
VHQYCLYVVVNGVTHCYPAGANSAGSISQKAIAHLPGCLFQRKVLLGLVGLYIPPLYSSRHTQTLSHLSNALSIGTRLSPPQLVVKVSHMQPYAQLIFKPNQNIKQTG